MKTLTKILTLILTIAIFTSCQERGVTSMSLSGSENQLPDELKGLKIYRVSTGGGSWVHVAVLDSVVNSVTHQVGKTQESTIVLNKQTGKTIQVSEVIMENDSLVVFKK